MAMKSSSFEYNNAWKSLFICCLLEKLLWSFYPTVSTRSFLKSLCEKSDVIEEMFNVCLKKNSIEKSLGTWWIIGTKNLSLPFFASYISRCEIFAAISKNFITKLLIIVSNLLKKILANIYLLLGKQGQQKICIRFSLHYFFNF